MNRGKPDFLHSLTAVFLHFLTGENLQIQIGVDTRIICGDCGSFYGSKVWNSTSKYRRMIWQCNAKFKGEHKCTTPHLTEEDVKVRFLAAFSTLLDGKDAILENCEQVVHGLHRNRCRAYRVTPRD